MKSIHDLINYFLHRKAKPPKEPHERRRAAYKKSKKEKISYEELKAVSLEAGLCIIVVTASSVMGFSTTVVELDARASLLV